MTPDPSPAPLILTLTLDAAAQHWFDALRREHFPAGRTQVGAHVTMFHALPGVRERSVVREVAAVCRLCGPLTAQVSGLRFLGRGVAFGLDIPGAARLRQALATAFARELTPQDQAAWKPHVTVQNKVDPAHARQTQAILATLVWPATIQATGIAVWRYKGGPWEALCGFDFDPDN